MISEEQLKQIQEEAEAKAHEIAETILGDSLSKLDDIRDELAKMEASTRDLQKTIDIINIRSGLHPKIKLAFGFRSRVDPVAALRDGIMLTRFNERN